MERNEETLVVKQSYDLKSLKEASCLAPRKITIFGALKAVENKGKM